MADLTEYWLDLLSVDKKELRWVGRRVDWKAEMWVAERAASKDLRMVELMDLK